jgi:hypothetical protein
MVGSLAREFTLRLKYPEFLYALRAGKEVADRRVERSLYSRAVGCNYEAVKIFMPANRSQPVYAQYIEHIPPDVTACIFWLKNRDPQHWRDNQQMEHVLGEHIISDKPMSEEEWARERADVLDAEPQFGDGRPTVNERPRPDWMTGAKLSLTRKPSAPQQLLTGV